MSMAEDVARLKREVRVLRAGMALGAILLVAAAAMPAARSGQLHRLAIVDGTGRERIILDANDGRPTIDIRARDGTRRVSFGEAGDPLVDGRRVARIAPAWGLIIYNPSGDERGGFSYLDNGRSVVSLDRAHGDGIYMTVNERSGFAGVVANYESTKAGSYAEALRLGTLGSNAFAQVGNRDGSAAGAIVAGAGGRARLTDVVQR